MRAKMSREQRAKQFIPFTPLEGLEEALRAVEKKLEVSFVAEPAVLDDQVEIIDRKLKELQSGQYVCVEVYSQGTRQEVSGEVLFIDDEIVLVGEEEILIKNILGIFNEADFLEDKLFGEKDRYDSFIHMANEQEIELTDNDIKCDDFDIVVFSSMC